MEEKLIEFVKNNTFIYDKKSRHNKNILLRDKKFQELSVVLNIPAKRLKQRWRTLRDKFYKELKRGSDTTSSGKQWKWMNHLMFLKDVDNVYPSRSSSDNYSRDWKLNNESSASASSTCQEVVSPALASNDPLKNFTCTFEDNAPTRIEAKKNKIDDILLEAKQEMSEVISLAKEIFVQPAQPEPKTTTQHFFDFMAKQTEDANLSPADFSILQMELLRAFNKVVHKSEH